MYACVKEIQKIKIETDAVDVNNCLRQSQISDFTQHVRTYLWVTILPRYHLKNFLFFFTHSKQFTISNKYHAMVFVPKPILNTLPYQETVWRKIYDLSKPLIWYWEFTPPPWCLGYFRWSFFGFKFSILFYKTI